MAVAGLPFEVQTLAFIGQNVQGQASWPHRPVEIVPAGNERELSKVTAPATGFRTTIAGCSQCTENATCCGRLQILIGTNVPEISESPDISELIRCQVVASPRRPSGGAPKLESIRLDAEPLVCEELRYE
jgi:hypothetical protein